MYRRVTIFAEGAFIEHWDEASGTLDTLAFEPARSLETVHARWYGNQLLASRRPATSRRREGGSECCRDHNTSRHLTPWYVEVA